jgi:hypothetical protein
MDDVLWLDSSVLRQLKRSDLRRLADLARKKGVSVVVHAHIHLEYCRYLRGSMRARGMEFSPSFVHTSLDQLEIKVADARLDREAAEAWAELLDHRYPDESAWKVAKLESIRARMPGEARLRPNEIPMTTDWLVALEVERQGARVAVRDNGPEWTALREAVPARALSYPEAMQWLEGRADVVPPLSRG